MNSSKQKYQIKLLKLLSAMLAAVLIIYFVAIKQTVSTYGQLKQSQSQEQNLILKDSVTYYNVQIQILDSLLNNKQKTVHSKNQFLDFVSGYCSKNKLRLFAVSEPIIIGEAENSFIIEHLKVQGGFKPLLKLLYTIQTEQSIQIVSARYQKEKNYSTKKEKLFLNIYYKL